MPNPYPALAECPNQEHPSKFQMPYERIAKLEALAEDQNKRIAQLERRMYHTMQRLTQLEGSHPYAPKELEA
jgi:hypothetical protein